MESFFNLKERNTTIRTEILAGITTFMTMAYISFVNAGMFSALPVALPLLLLLLNHLLVLQKVEELVCLL